MQKLLNEIKATEGKIKELNAIQDGLQKQVDQHIKDVIRSIDKKYTKDFFGIGEPQGEKQEITMRFAIVRGCIRLSDFQNKSKTKNVTFEEDKGY